jgi:hypothetical protein
MRQPGLSSPSNVNDNFQEKRVGRTIHVSKARLPAEEVIEETIVEATHTVRDHLDNPNRLPRETCDIEDANDTLDGPAILYCLG